MAKQIWWGLAAVGVLLAGVLLAALLRSSRCEVHVAVRGTPGMAIRGSYTADGVSTEFSEVVPAEIIFVARRADFRVERTSGEGRLEVALFLNDRLHTDSTAAGEDGRIEGRVISSILETRAALYSE